MCVRGYLHVFTDGFLSVLDSVQRERGEKAEGSEEERRRTGQLQCGQVCRVSRERERSE